MLAASRLRTPAVGHEGQDCRIRPRQDRAQNRELLLHRISPVIGVAGTTRISSPCNICRSARSSEVPAELPQAQNVAEVPKPDRMPLQWRSISMPACSVQSLRPCCSAKLAGQRRDRHGRSRRSGKNCVHFPSIRWRASTCVACGESAGLPDRWLDCRATMVQSKTALTMQAGPHVFSACPYCGVGCQLPIRSRSNIIRCRCRKKWPLPMDTGFCVKGRFGFN